MTANLDEITIADSDVLEGVKQSEGFIAGWLRPWASGLVRRDAQLYAYSPRQPILRGSPQTLHAFLAVWSGPRWACPRQVYVNGHPTELVWQPGPVNTVVSVLETHPWHRFENTIAARFPIAWQYLSLYPARVRSQCSPHSADEWPDFVPWRQVVHSMIRRRFVEASVPKPRQTDHHLHQSCRATDVDGAIAFMLRSINRDPTSPFNGLCYGCYDLNAASYRLASWVWTSAIVIQALLEAGHEGPRAEALALGNAILRFQVRHGANAGAYMVRHDPARDVPQGYTVWLAPNDAALLAGYGLLPLYQSTNDRRYWKSAVDVAAWIVTQGVKNGQLRVGYRCERGRWDDSWLYVDAGFTPVLFARLFELERDPQWASACTQIMDDLLRRLYAGGGRLCSSWVWPGRRTRALFTRGYAWFIDGLIHAYACSGDARYKRIAAECIKYLLQHQTDKGAWYYLMDKPESGYCNKATPAIAWQLLNYYERIAADHALILAARRALDWCGRAQYRGPIPLLRAPSSAGALREQSLGPETLPLLFPMPVRSRY